MGFQGYFIPSLQHILSMTQASCYWASILCIPELKDAVPPSGLHAFTVCHSVCIRYVSLKLNCIPSRTVIAFDAWRGEHQLVTSVQKASDWQVTLFLSEDFKLL
jgi:hypothetical protein